MRLLVSAASAADAAAAVEGGADIVDAKDPARGALGPVSPDDFAAIAVGVAGRRPVTAALGEAREPLLIETSARSYATVGASMVKVGFAGVGNLRLAHSLAVAAVRGARQGHASARVVLVAYADAPGAVVSPATLLEVASSAGAAGVLLDTADKSGPRLTELVSLAWLTDWVGLARRRSLLVCLAGRLRADDLPVVRRCGADIAGVRGAACEGGRAGRIDAARVRGLRCACEALEAIAQP
jgi:(5-formylfuran-3-yl)methyl phosphate synthase